MIVKIDNQEFEIPDTKIGGGLTGHELKQALKVDKPILYEVNDEGHTIVSDDEPVQLHEGQQFGAMERVIAGARNVSRVNLELGILVATYRKEFVDWLPNLDFVHVHNFKLPAGYNTEATNVLIAVPDNYGNGTPLRECYVDPNLRYWSEGQWVEIPHYFDRPETYAPRRELLEMNWRYLCLHMVQWPPTSNFTTFLKAIYTFLSNPLYPWPTL